MQSSRGHLPASGPAPQRPKRASDRVKQTWAFFAGGTESALTSKVGQELFHFAAVESQPTVAGRSDAGPSAKERT